MTNPTPHGQVPEALTHERDRAIMEGERNASLTAFDHDGSLTLAEERLYEAAFTNGWDRHAAVVAPTSAPMSPANRLVAYSAATRLRELGFEWDATAEAWLQPAQPAAPQPAPSAQAAGSVQEDAARYRFIRDVPYSDDVRSVLVHQQNAAMDRVIDAALAARKQGASQ